MVSEKSLIRLLSNLIKKQGIYFKYTLFDFGILPPTILHYKLHEPLYLQLEDEFYKHFEKDISKILTLLLTCKLVNLKQTVKKLNQQNKLLFYNTSSPTGLILQQVPDTSNIILTIGFGIPHNAV